MRYTFSHLVYGFLLVTSAVQAPADLLTTSADAYIERGTANNNYGSSIQLRTKNDAGNFVRKSYIRFDLSTLSFDHTTEDFTANLSLTFFDTNAGNGGEAIDWVFSVWGLNDGDAGEAWGESTITWNNAPQNDLTSGNNMLAGATQLGGFNINGRTANIDFGGTAVRDFVAASSTDHLVTFVVVRDTPQPDAGNSYVHAAASREHTGFDGPELTLTQIPEPSSLLLLSLGLSCLARPFRFLRS